MTQQTDETRVLKVVESLVDATAKGEVPWELAGSENRIVVLAGSSTITLHREFAGFLKHDEKQFNFVVRIANQDGFEVSRVDVKPTHPLNKFLSAMWDQALRAALSVDATLESLETAVSSNMFRSRDSLF